MSKIEEHVGEIFDFEGNQDPVSFEERSGPPQELPAVVGLVSINFQELQAAGPLFRFFKINTLIYKSYESL